MITITQLQVDNYRSLSDLDLHLDPVSLLTGLNGSGKTSVLLAIAAIRDLVIDRRRAVEAFPPATLTRWDRKKEQTFRIKCSGDDPLEPGRAIGYTYELTIEHEVDRDKPTGKARVLRERLSIDDNRPLFEFAHGKVQLYRDDHSEGPPYSLDWELSGLATVQLGREDNKRLTEFVKMLGLVRVLHLIPDVIADVSEQPEERLAFSGANLAAWLRWLFDDDQGFSSALQNVLKDVIADFSHLRNPEVGGGRNRHYLVRNQGDNSLMYDLSELSSGELALIVLHTLLLDARKRGGVVCVDEPGNFLALPEIRPWLIELSDLCREGKVQAILTSHHPELVNYLGPESGIWMRRSDEGTTACVPLADLLEDIPLDPAQTLARGWVR